MTQHSLGVYCCPISLHKLYRLHRSSCHSQKRHPFWNFPRKRLPQKRSISQCSSFDFWTTVLRKLFQTYFYGCLVRDSHHVTIGLHNSSHSCLCAGLFYASNHWGSIPCRSDECICLFQLVHLCLVLHMYLSSSLPNSRRHHSCAVVLSLFRQAHSQNLDNQTQIFQTISCISWFQHSPWEFRLSQFFRPDWERCPCFRSLLAIANFCLAPPTALLC